jgi:hypothetical protein
MTDALMTTERQRRTPLRLESEVEGCIHNPRTQGRQKQEEAGRTLPGLQRERGPADTLISDFHSPEL